MKRLVPVGVAALALFLPVGPAGASGDTSCYPTWSLYNRDFGCANSAALAPGNDSRVNLLHLMRDRQGAGSAGLSYPKRGWEERLYGRAFFDWSLLKATYYPQAPVAVDEEPRGPDWSGSRCISLTTGDPAFRTALAANGKVPEAERAALLGGRDTLIGRCSATSGTFTPVWPSDIRSAPGKEYLGYLTAADAFYAGDWAAARQGFSGLARSRDSWLAETAAYMVPRVDLNAAQAASFNEWGDLDRDKAADSPGLRGARAGFERYIKRYAERGRYAASARGLIRRTVWLSGDTAALARTYEALLASTPAAQAAAADLVQEIDNKLIVPRSAATPIDGPLLLATTDLMRMRDTGESGEADISAAEIAAQESRFAGRADLFGFIQASHAFYVAKDYRRVLTLVPDDARRSAFSPLQFSRQVLRGQALNALKDRNEAGFWREMLSGADRLYQRPLVELALATNWENGGKLADVFAPNSPITDPSIREILMIKVAGPAILRAQARDGGRSQHERDVALFTLLIQQLRRGDYAGFGRDLALVPAGASAEGGVWNIQQQEQVPVGLFRKGVWSDGYACPALSATAATLARNPRDARARLCLGDFYRINGFDWYGEERLYRDPNRPRPLPLGSSASQFPGKDIPRAALYADIIADAAAPAEDKAYALFRAINCYATSGNNSCGGEDVPKSQRHAWFRRLKGEFAGSPWAKQLKYYW